MCVNVKMTCMVDQKHIINFVWYYLFHVIGGGRFIDV